MTLWFAKKTYLCTSMKWKNYTPASWFCLVLFILYAGGMSLFTHTHIINKTIYVHSHPFKQGTMPTHDHAEKELQLLDQIFKTSLTPDIIPAIDVVGIAPSVSEHYPVYYQPDHLIRTAAPRQLRAPPIAA